jgi:DNA adenine methylase
VAVKPFLKWAGGKRWLVSSYKTLFPNDYNRYFEPFLGSGAVFFQLEPNRAFISDTNSDLIDSYLGIQKNWCEVYRLLQYHHKKHSKSYYYMMRDYRPTSLVRRSARFIYLNRTCWNGLYRVNLKGKFNVPIGTKTSVIFNDDNFDYISRVLQNSNVTHRHYSQSISLTRPNDFIFVDPPYTVRHNNNGFIKYNENLFSWDDQINLAAALRRADSRGVKILMTNAFHESVRELYEQNFELTPVLRHSSISGKPSSRKHYEEYIIKNF